MSHKTILSKIKSLEQNLKILRKKENLKQKLIVLKKEKLKTKFDIFEKYLKLETFDNSEKNENFGGKFDNSKKF